MSKTTIGGRMMEDAELDAYLDDLVEESTRRQLFLETHSANHEYFDEEAEDLTDFEDDPWGESLPPTPPEQIGPKKFKRINRI